MGSKVEKNTTPFDNSYIEKWFSQEFSLVTGLFHLKFDGSWQCIFASKECLKVLQCDSKDFLEKLLSLSVRTSFNTQEKKVEELLQDVISKSRTGSFICIRKDPCDKRNQYIKGTLSLSYGSDGTTNIHGQITDVSGEEEENVLSQKIQMMHQAGMKMTGRSFGQYSIKGRQLTVMTGFDEQVNIPKTIANMPEWCVKNGYIATQSQEDWYNFFDLIDKGEKQCSVDVWVDVPERQIKRRIFIEAIGIADKKGQAQGAIISQMDITNEYEWNTKKELERTGLIQIAQLVFPEILSANLTNGTCNIIQTVVDTPKNISLDKLLESRICDIAEDDREAFKKQFFRENQLQEINRGKKRFQLTYKRRNDEGEWHWIETTSVQLENAHNDDILTYTVSRNVDFQKTQEDLLKRALADSTEKLEGWLYYTSLCSQSFPGLIFVNYNDGRASPYSVGKLAERLDCQPKDLAMATCFRTMKEDKNIVQQAHEQAQKQGSKNFTTEYRIETDRGEITWVNNHAVYFKDKNGDTGHIHFLTDTTQEHLLMEQVRSNMEDLLNKNQQIFNMVSQHSNRILYEYDIAAGITRPWNQENKEKDVLFHLYQGVYSENSVEHNAYVMPECVESTKKFFKDIHGGVPVGQMNIHIKMKDGQAKWYHFKYSTIFEGEKPATALISVEDITEQHEHEMVYLRHIQSLSNNMENQLLFIESCLVCDKIEKFSGKMTWPQDEHAQYSHSNFVDKFLGSKFAFEKLQEAKDFFSCENLMDLFRQGQKQLNTQWKVQFSDNSTHWINFKTELIEEPFNGHVKSFTIIKDITKEHDLKKRADYDTMTGLLRKDVGESILRKTLSSSTNTEGILIILDLDDLKAINDNLGHIYGDKAINGIAQTLKSHFRKDDILIRAGGDEFIVYLPKAGKNVDSVEHSLESLLSKLASTYIDENNERTIHCSIGCAAETAEDDNFESLYKRADIALYHVKRNGKNNYAFFVPEMLEEDYKFRTRQMHSIVNDMAKDQETKHLLEIVSSHYPGIFHFNLSTNFFHVLSIANIAKDSKTCGTLDEFHKIIEKDIHPEEKGKVLDAISRKNLLECHEQGKHSLKLHYNNTNKIGSDKTEIAIQLFTTKDGDLCAFLFFRWNSSKD